MDQDGLAGRDFLALRCSICQAAAGAPEANRLTAVARAYRDWALAHPNSYLLTFQTSSGSGLELEPERTVAAAQRSMDVILGALSGAAGADLGPELTGQIEAWGQRSQVPGLTAGQRYLGPERPA